MPTHEPACAIPSPAISLERELQEVGGGMVPADLLAPASIDGRAHHIPDAERPGFHDPGVRDRGAGKLRIRHLEGRIAAENPPRSPIWPPFSA